MMEIGNPQGQDNGGWHEVPSGNGSSNQDVPPQNPVNPGIYNPQGYKVDVTPNNPLQPGSPVNLAKKRKQSESKGLLKYAIIGIIIVFIAVVAFATLHKPAPVSTTVTTSIKANVYSFDSCQVFSKPGSYYLSSDIATKMSSGSCISINASNVALVCNGKSITGDGPFINSTPYTYGISVNNNTNVSISGCSVSDFSYGIASFNSSGVKIASGSIFNNTMSDIYLANTSVSSITQNKLSGASSAQGALYVGANSYSNKIINNSISSNSRAGINIYATNQSIYDNNISSTPVSFACYGASGLLPASKASLNKCSVNYGCSFLSCNVINTAVNISQISLGHVINGCGVISSPGNYHIADSINVQDFISSVSAVNASGDESGCIKIESPEVHLDCNSNNISNSYYGPAISANGIDNISISYCNIKNSKYGIMLENVNDSLISNITIRNASEGIALYNSSSNKINNVSSLFGGRGLYIYSSTLDSLTSFNLSNDSYGIYLSGSIGNVFNKGLAQNNEVMDVYATNNSRNASYNFMASTSCGLTDAAWATCINHIQPSLKFYPVSGCTSIKHSGNYTLQSNIAATEPECITISASNVTFSCNNHTIDVSAFPNSYGIYANREKNITINNCGVNKAKYGIYLSNDSFARISGGTFKHDFASLYASNVSFSKINGTTSYNSSYGMILNNSHLDMLENNTIKYGTGIMLQNSTTTAILNNTGVSGTYGLSLNGSSQNNTISDNIFTSNSKYDYICSQQTSGISAEDGGVNYGSKESDCNWLAAIPQGAPPLECDAFFHPSSYSLSSDAAYGIGQTCNGVYANDTVLNCNYHTIIATNGGTFATFTNVKNAEIEDCYLKGFTNPIIARNSSVKMLNDVLYVNATENSAYNPYSPLQPYGIVLSGSSGFDVKNVTVISMSSGIGLFNSKDGKLNSNNVTANIVSYYISNVTGTQINNNIAGSASTIGISINNSTQNTFGDNNFAGQIEGAVCSGSSRSNSTDINSGGNVCSLNNGCLWLGSC